MKIGTRQIFYAVHWWIKDDIDVLETDGILTLAEARKIVKREKAFSSYYHDFTIYTYEAEYINEPFEYASRIYDDYKWQRTDKDITEITFIK
jgi:S-methylmethionine-dependent homocysteine/selenocysteine methylase